MARKASSPGGWARRDGWCRQARWARAGFSAVASTRALGDMKNTARRGRALKGLGLSPAAWAGGRQVHGRRVRWVTRPTAPREWPATDGLLTATPGLALRVFTADCVPVFIADPVTGALGLLHAGWRGVRGKILTRALSLLKRRTGAPPGRLWVSLGPHIRSCCYEVGEDVAHFFRDAPLALKKGRPRHWFLDLARALKNEARLAGVPARHFTAAPWCTGHDKAFFSHRREKTERRQGTFLWRGEKNGEN